LRKLVLVVLAIVAILAAMPSSATTVTIPDPDPLAFISFGQGDASVTYSGVTFTQSSAYGNANFFNVGHLFSGDLAVLSSQEASVGPENILVSLPTTSTFFSVAFGTFNGSDVTFTLSNGATFVESSLANDGYAASEFFAVSSTPFDWVQITSPDFVLNIRDITYSTTSTPEPGSLVLLGAGLVGMTGLLRRKLK